jgi:phosphoglycerate dehydrogenase-like enzyme
MIYTASKEFLDYLNNHNEPLEVVAKEKARILITGSYQKEDYFPSHEVIIVPFTGLNQIDLEFVKSKGIRVFNTQAHSRYVAERALALLLNLLGKVTLLDKDLRKGFWAHRNNEQRILWVSVFNKKVGFFGYGAINQHLHQLLKPFNIKTFIIDRGKDYRDVHKVKDLEALAKVSDVIIIAAPLSQDTEGVFNQTILNTMKNSYLVNVGRGPIINEKALYGALKNKVISGFASDVWFNYPSGDNNQLPSNYPFESFENVVMTPHNGGFTETAMDDRYEDVLRKIKQAINGNFTEALV